MDGQVGEVQPAVHFEKLVQVAVTVSDLVRAKAFYRDIVGMKLLFEAGNMCFFQCGGVRFMIGTQEDGKPVSGSGTILYFHVADIHRAYDSVADRGVEVLQKPHLIAKMTDHDLWLALIKDPDGNVLGMMSEMAHAVGDAKG
jgi:methylmalonyl-CoA/ethylmalonyl-CoA epimerase